MNRILTSSLRRGAAAGRQLGFRAVACDCGRSFSSTPAAFQSIPIKVQGTGTGTVQKLSIPGKPYTFTADTYTLLGGTDSSPSPVVYSLASLGSCNQVTGSIVAKDHGIRVGEWNVDVEGQLPTEVLVKGAEGNSNWVSVVLKARVQTDIPGGTDSPKFQHFVSEIERRCPITQLFKLSGVKMTSEWTNEAL